MVTLREAKFAWRLLYDRIPTKQNLCRRGILVEDNLWCVRC